MPVDRLLLSTDPGIEDVAAREFEERARAAGAAEVAAERRPYGLRGRVAAAADAGAALPAALAMRSIHHVVRPLAAFELDDAQPLAGLAAALEGVEVDALAGAGSFRVLCNRVGEHDFSSMDVEREAGAVLQRRYGTAVDLDDWEVGVRVDVLDRVVVAGLQVTRTPLSRRWDKPFTPRTALKATMAYALLRLAEIGPGDTVLDPFCGSATILLEAAAAFPEAAAAGSDRDGRVVRGARLNLEAAGFGDRIEVRPVDARQLAAAYPGGFSAIVTNPPYGVRLSRKADMGRLYTLFLAEAHAVLAPGGRMVLLVCKRASFEGALRRTGVFKVRHVRKVETGGIFPSLFVLDRG